MYTCERDKVLFCVYCLRDIDQNERREAAGAKAADGDEQIQVGSAGPDAPPSVGEYDNVLRLLSDAQVARSALDKRLATLEAERAALVEPLEMLARRGCFLWLHVYADGRPFVVLGDYPGAGNEWGGQRFDGDTVVDAVRALVASLPQVQQEALRAQPSPTSEAKDSSPSGGSTREARAGMVNQDEIDAQLNDIVKRFD